MLLELEIKLLVGEINYLDVETGFWALKDDELSYRIIDLPDELKKNGLKIAAIAQIPESEDSIYITTQNIKLIEYKILTNYGNTS